MRAIILFFHRNNSCITATLFIMIVRRESFEIFGDNVVLFSSIAFIVSMLAINESMRSILDDWSLARYARVKVFCALNITVDNSPPIIYLNLLLISAAVRCNSRVKSFIFFLKEM